MIDKNLIIKDIKDILSVFKELNIPIYLSYGALLGAVRDKDFIEWDDDVDFDVVAPIDIKTRKIIGWLLDDLGFNPQDIWFTVFGRLEPMELGYNGDEETGIIAIERNFKFSIFFYKDDGDHYVCVPRRYSLPMLEVPKKFFEKHGKIKLHGVKFETPAPQKEYLEWVYGDWKTPREGFHAPQCKDRAKNKDIF